MYLLQDEIAFLKNVTTGRSVEMPRERDKRLIVQILLSYRLVWLRGDHLIPADRGVSLLAVLFHPRERNSRAVGMPGRS